MDKIKFSPDDPSGIEIVRSIVFLRLRKGGWKQLYQYDMGFDEYLEYEGDERAAREKVNLLAMEIMWQLISQGIITPGINLANPNLPWFRLTDYGKKVIQEEKFIPHDPSGYLERSKEIITDDIVLKYLQESLPCFTTGCYLASTMMLGIASERTFLSLCDSLLNAISSATKKQKFEKILEGVSMIAKFNFVQTEIDTLMSARKGVLPGNTRTHLLGIFDFIRVQRNDIGHPQDDLQLPERDTVYVNLRLFPQYCKTVEAVKTYLQENKI